MIKVNWYNSNKFPEYADQSTADFVVGLPETLIAGDCNQVPTSKWGPEEIKRLIQIGLDAELDRCDERVIRAQAALERALQARQQKIIALSEGKF